MVWVLAYCFSLQGTLNIQPFLQCLKQNQASTFVWHVCLLVFCFIYWSELSSSTGTLNVDLFYRNVSQDLSESILTMVGNCSLLLTKPRQPPPGVLRHRGIEPAFNSSSLGGQVSTYPQQTTDLTCTQYICCGSSPSTQPCSCFPQLIKLPCISLHLSLFLQAFW